MTRMSWLVPVVAVVLGACADTPTTPFAGVPQESRVAPSPNVVDVALTANGETGEFSTLIAALVKADLVGALQARGQNTVFAPTDEAFAALGITPAVINGMSAEEVAELRNILLYHVANGRREAADVVSSTRIRMLNRGFAMISLQADGAYINEAKIIDTDLPASNGIIHVINGVLIP